MVNDPFDYDPVPFQSAGKIKVRYKMGECDNTANAGEAKPFNATWEPKPYAVIKCQCCGRHHPEHSDSCGINTQTIHRTYGLDEPTRKMIEQLLAGNLERLAGRVIGLLRKILEGQQTMASATKDAIDALVNDVNTATASIAARIAALEAQGQRTDMTADEEAAVVSELTAAKAALTALVTPPTP